ncbi:hypothetical protein V6N13_058833 [Hibiscus sabdariffa]
MQPFHELIVVGRIIVHGYMQWFIENEKPYILTLEERSQQIPRPRPERLRQQRTTRNRSNTTSTEMRRMNLPGSSSCTTQRPTLAPALPPPPIEFVTPVPPPSFTHSSHLTFQFMENPSQVFPLLGTKFSSDIVKQTVSGSLFVIGPSGSSGDDEEDDDGEDSNEPHRRYC